MENGRGSGQDIHPSDLTNPVIQGLYQEYKYFESLEKEAGRQKRAALMALRACGVSLENMDDSNQDTPLQETTLSKERFYAIGTSNGCSQKVISQVFNALRRKSQTVIRFDTVLPRKEQWKNLFDINGNIVFEPLAMFTEKDLLSTHRIGKTGLEAIQKITGRVKQEMTADQADLSDALAQND